MRIISLLVLAGMMTVTAAAETPRRLVETACPPERLLALAEHTGLAVLHRGEPLMLLLADERGAARLTAANISWRDVGPAPSNKDVFLVAAVPAAESAVLAWHPLARLSDGRFIVASDDGTLLPDAPGIFKMRLPRNGRALDILRSRDYASPLTRDFDQGIQDLVDDIQQSRLQQILATLVNFQTRYSTTTGCQQAVNWSVDFFEGLGLQTETHAHTSGMAPNVLAWQTGTVNPDRVWILGGHIDSTSDDYSRQNCPGADDNGTGAALTLLVAEMLQNQQFEDTIVYALWTGEEQGLYGSAAWADDAAGEGLDIQGYLNFDMAGWVEPSPEDLEVFVNTASQAFGQDFISAGQMYTALPFSYRPTAVYGSDHNSFWDNGFIAFCGIEDYPLTYDYYHTTQDTLDKINMPFFTNVTRAALAGLATFAVRLPGEVVLTAHEIDDSSGDNDGAADPGETIGIIVTLRNYTSAAVENVAADLSAVSGAQWIQLVDNHAEFGAIPSGGTADNDSDPFSVLIAAGTPEGTVLTFNLAISGAGYSNSQTFTVTVTTLRDVCPFLSWPMDANPGWAFTGQWAWGQPTGGGGSWGEPDPTSGHTGTNVVGYRLSGDYANNMPRYYATAGPLNFTGLYAPELRFWRWLGVESSQYDHASVEVSTNGSTFTSLWENGTSSMSDSAWTEVHLALGTAVENQPQVWIRWVMGTTDSYVVYCGWNIDDVEICGQQQGAPQPTATPTVALTATPSPAPSATSTRTPTRSPTLTMTRTATRTASPTRTPTVTSSPTASPSRTPTPSPTSSPTATSTPTPVWTPTPWPSETPTPPVSPTPICLHDGDVNGNGVVTAEDAQIGFTFYLDCAGYAPTLEQYCAADYC